MREEVFQAMESLLDFSIHYGLLQPEERRWARNLLLDAMRYDAPAEDFEHLPASVHPETATGFLAVLLEDAVTRELIQDTVTQRDLLSARLMGLLTASPTAIQEKFDTLRSTEGIRAATDWFYALSRANDYIQVDAIAKNLDFFEPSPYGELEITINLSKPEKDPRDIAALLTQKAVGYPKCMLCPENEGYAGRLDFPARQTLRLIPLQLDGQPYYLQFSPYLYYPEHIIVLHDQHIPMSITRSTFARLMDFLGQFPHYFIGSNADLPIVGGSILNHDHFQGGKHHFPMEAAPAWGHALHPGHPDVACECIEWPVTTARLTSKDPEALVMLATEMLASWRGYSDAALEVLSHTGDTPHNTLTPIARRQGKTYQLDLSLRNNRTTGELPLGIFHPHPDLHHIKKENIGLIEVMGLFILPGRLKEDLEELAKVLHGTRPVVDILEGHTLYPHMPWMEGLIQRYGIGKLSLAESAEALREALGERCARVLYDSGVFKLDDGGKAGMRRFMEHSGFSFT